MQSRAFNTVIVDPTKNFLVKSSEQNCQKIKDEIEYYLNLPHSLNNLFPELLDYAGDYSKYTLKFYPYNNLAQVFLNTTVTINEGKEIVSKLINTAEQFHKIKAEATNQTQVIDFYINKTLKRVSQVATVDGFSELMKPDYLTINNTVYPNFNTIKNEFTTLFRQHAVDCVLTAVHGDFCFSNILYCPATKAIKLIDPRGSFISRGIYGEKHYDYAKLMHCLHGRYDYLVNDKFSIQENSVHNFTISIPSNPLLDELHHFYAELLEKNSINLEFIYLIEASLFLSMIPLHYENIERQKMFYFTGLMLLNELLAHSNNNL